MRGVCMHLRYIRKPTIGERIASFILDHVLIVGFISIITIPIMFSDNKLPKLFTFSILTIVIPLLYIFKDIVGGRSVGKRVFKIGVRNSNNPDELPAMGRLLVRNLTLFILPIEFLVLLFSTRGKKIGDLMAGTIVVKLDNIPDGENTFIREYEYQKANQIKVSEGKNIKIFIIIGVMITLVSFILAGGMLFAFKNSVPYEKSLEAIESSELVEEFVGEVTGYGALLSGSISNSNGSGQANFRIKVKGTEGECDVVIYLVKEPSKGWEVINAGILE